MSRSNDKTSRKSAKKKKASAKEDRVVLVDGLRTPFVKAHTDFQEMDSLELSRALTAEFLARTDLDPEIFDEVIMGTVLPSVSAPNLAREMVLATDLPKRIPGHTVSRACASSAQAVIAAAEGILQGQYQAVLAGGAESMSNVPVPYNKGVIDSLMALSKARSIPARMKALAGIPFDSLLPTPPSISESSTGKTMGEHAESMAVLNDVTRHEQDEFALASHRNAAAARQAGLDREEIMTVYSRPSFRPVEQDSFVREDASLEALSQLRPVFDRNYGTITAGNSSGLTDGAAISLIMSESRAQELGLTPLAAITHWSNRALDPQDQLLIGPALCIPEVLDEAVLTLDDIDLIDLHEAFAAQVLSVVKALESKEFARAYLGRDEAVGKVDRSKLNVNGGSIALGHPFGATGSRMLNSMARELHRREANRAIVSLCAAGGMGTALLLERI